MKLNKQMFIFVLLCSVVICILAFPAAAHAEPARTDSAKAAIVFDPRTGEILYAHDEHERLPMASTTKIMSALIALESGGLDEPFTVDSRAIRVEGSSMGLTEGDCVTMRALVCGMLLPSGNDAANAAAVRVAGSTEDFVRLMNGRAEQMGLHDTHFVTPSGLDDDTDEHYSSAYDMAVLTAYALDNADFSQICSQKYIKVNFGNPPQDRWLTNTNRLLDSCEGVIGVKTGFTDKARRCLVSACERDGARLICVTLNDPDDWKDHSALYDKCFAKMRLTHMEGSGHEYEIAAAGGEKPVITAVAAPLDLMLPETAADKITAKVRLKHFVFAPVESGEQVGCIAYYLGEKLICELPIRAAEGTALRKAEKSEWKKLLRNIDDILGKADRYGLC